MAGTFAVFCTTVALFDTNQLEPMQEYLFHTSFFIIHFAWQGLSVSEHYSHPGAFLDIAQISHTLLIKF